MQELTWPEETPKALLMVILGALAHFHADRRYSAIVSAIGTLLCSVAPAETVLYCEFIRVGAGWESLKEPFASLSQHAADRTRIAVGATAARRLLSVHELHGERSIVLYNPHL
jgi:hypothetical protein